MYFRLGFENPLRCSYWHLGLLGQRSYMDYLKMYGVYCFGQPIPEMGLLPNF